MVSLNKILGKNSFDLIFLLLEKEKLHVRGIAEELDLAPSTVHFLLDSLKLKKIVVFEKKKNFVLFQLNKNSPVLKELLALIFTDKIVFSKAFSKLVKLKPLFIGLYGSVAKGELSKNSDVDLFVLFKDKKPGIVDLQLIARELSRTLEREVNISSFTEKSFQNLKRNDLVFYTELLLTSKALYGEL